MALFSVFQAQAAGEDIIFNAGEVHVLDELRDFNSVNVYGSKSITVRDIYSPTGYFGIDSPFKLEFLEKHNLTDASWDEIVAVAVQYDIEDVADLARVNITGNVDVKQFIFKGIGTITGNITTYHGEITQNDVENNLNVYEGVFQAGGSYSLGGVRVNGNIDTGVLYVSHYQPNKTSVDYVDEGTACAGLIVRGDVITDWLVVDPISANPIYDNFSDYLEVHGDVVVNNNLYSGGKILIDGKLTVDGILYNARGEYVEKPELTSPEEDYIYGGQPPDYIATSVTELDAKNIQNASNLFVGKLTNDREQVYTQTYGTIRVTDNWFRDSVINMSGGIINEDSLGPDKNLGINNVYNITGGTLIVGDLNFDSTVNLSQDGKIQTDIESIFINPDGDPEALNYVGLNASEPESVKASLTKWFTNYVAGTLRTDLEDHVNFNGGSIVVSGFGKITQTQYDDLMEAFKEAFGDRTDIEFDGEIAGVSTDDIFNIATLKEVQENVPELEDALFVDRTLLAEGKDVIVGEGELASAGFVSIDNAKSVTVKDGKTLALIGTETEDALVNTSISVDGTGSKLVLGTLGLEKSADLKGSLSEVTLSGASGLEVRSGQYTVSTIDGQATNGANVTIGSGATLKNTSLALAGSTLSNAGKFEGGTVQLSDGSLENTGTMNLTGGLTGTNGATFTNRGTLRVEGDSNITGTFTNTAKATLGNMTIDGSFVNNAGANVEMNTLTVTGQLANRGDLTAKVDSSLSGILENYGTINLHNGDVLTGAELTNEKTIIGQGTINVNGLLANVNDADFTAEGTVVTLSGNQATIANGNGGVFRAESLVLRDGATFINGATGQYGLATMGLTRAATRTELENLDVGAGTSNENLGVGYYGSGTVAGTFTTGPGAQSYAGISDVYADGKGLTVASTGKLDIQEGGAFTMGGALTNAGTISGTGSLVLLHADTGTNVFNNSGTINVGNLTANNITFNQTGGSVNATTGWFENSIVNVSTGSMSHDTMGVGNTYTVGVAGNSGANASLAFDTLTSDSTVNIVDGGTLDASKIALTKPEKTVHLKGGTLATSLDQIFNDVKHEALDIDASDPDDMVDLVGIKIATAVSDVIDSVAKGIEFAWGTVSFSDEAYSVSLVNDVTQKLDAVDPDDPDHTVDELQVVFTGKSAERFNVDVANKVLAEDAEGGATYATFASEELFNEVAANTGYDKLFVGKADSSSEFLDPDSMNILSTSIGFKGIKGSQGGVWVQDGKHLVLVGEKGSVSGAENYQLTDGGDIVISGRESALGAISTVTLGSYGSTERTKGQLANVYVGADPAKTDEPVGNAILRVRNGDFTAKDIYNGSQIFVGGDGTSLPKDTQASLTAENLYMTTSSEVHNYGVLNLGQAQTVAGNQTTKIVNEATGQLTADSIDIVGRLENKNTMDVGSLTIRSGATGDDLAVSLVNGSANSGTLTAQTVLVDADYNWDATHTSTGGMNNTGKFIVEETMTVKGHMQNADKGELQVKTLALEGQLTTLEGSKATVDVLSQTAGKVSNAGEMTLAQTTGASSVAGEFANSGKLTVSAGSNALQVVTGGSLTNAGTIDADAEVQISGGRLTAQASSTTDLSGLAITAGDLVTEAGSSVKDAGTTSINMADASSIAINNAGTFNSADLDVVKGTIQGGTVQSADASVETEGMMSGIIGAFEKLVNSGKVLLASGSIDALTNNASGTVESDGALTVAGTNAGTLNVKDSGSYQVEAGKTFTNEKDLTVDGSASIEGTLATTASGTTNLNGEASVTGLVNNAGTLNLADTTVEAGGKISNSGTLEAVSVELADGSTLTFANGSAHVEKLDAQAGSVIESNGGTSAVDDLNATNVTYNQTGGVFSAAAGWFKDSVLNIMGGTLDASGIKDDEGNASGSLGHNTVNISGQTDIPVINDADSPDQKKDWANGMTVVKTDTLTSETTVNIAQGGVLDVENISLDSGNKTLTLNGGAVQTGLDQIFSSVTTEGIKIEATDPETGSVDFETEVIASTDVGAVKDSITQNVAVNSGDIVFDDKYFSWSTVESAADKLADAFDMSETFIHFIGSMAEDFTVDTAKDLIAEGTEAVLGGIVLDNTTLHNTTADAGDANKDLVIGGTASGANSIDLSMGFKNVANAESVTVTGGKEFVLVGGAEGDYHKDGNKLLTDSANGGKVTAENGTFTMGSWGMLAPTKGWVAEVETGSDGKFVTKNGEFGADTLTNVGSTTITSGSTLHSQNIANSGTIQVEGNADFADLDNTGTVSVAGSGHLALTATDVLAGTVNNAGQVTQTGATDISGQFTSTGTGKGSFENASVSGTFNAEAGSANTFEHLTVADGGKVDNAGTLEATGTEGEGANTVALEVAENGTFTNAGTVINEHSTSVLGSWINNAVATVGNFIVGLSGSAENNGTETAKNVQVAEGGSYTNNKTANWTDATIAGSAVNNKGGLTTVEGTLDIAQTGSYLNKGSIDATEGKVNVAGSFTNDNFAHFDTLDVALGGQYINNASEDGDALTIAGAWTNNAESEWKSITVAENGTTSFGKQAETVTDKVTVAGGSLIVNAGVFETKDADFASGVFVVGNNDTVNEANKVSFETSGTVNLNTQSWVIGNGNLAFGTDAGFADSIGADKMPAYPARVSVGKTVTVGKDGSLTVGTGTWTGTSTQANANAGSLNFGKDSTLFVDAGTLGVDGIAFQGTADTATITVANGSQLVLGNLKEIGKYIIAEDFDTSANFDAEGNWIGGWDGENLYALPQTGSGLGWTLSLGHDADSVWVNAWLESISTLYPDVAIPDNVDWDINHPGESGVDGDWVHSVIYDENHTPGDKTQVINSVAEIGFASGSMATAVNATTMATNAVEDRVSMTGDAFNGQGLLARDPEMANSLWVDVLANRQEADGYEFTGNMTAGFEAYSYGFVMGYDRLVTPNTIAGAAFSYQKGNSNSQGDVLKTDNEFETYGIHAYAAWSPSAKLNVIGTVAYLHNTNEAEQALPFGNADKAKADIDTNIVTAGVRAESTFVMADGSKIVPHIGARVIHADQGTFDTKLDGAKSFENQTDAATLVQFPIGVTARTTKTFDNGWTVNPAVDFTVIPQVGDTDQRIRIEGSQGVTDDIRGDFTGNVVTQTTFGVQATKGQTTFGGRYSANIGGDGRMDHQLKVEFRYNF